MSFLFFTCFILVYVGNAAPARGNWLKKGRFDPRKYAISRRRAFLGQDY
jgi:hypothetical protein